MKRTLQIFFLLVLASTAVACACNKPYPYEPPEPGCVTDEKCAPDEICKDGECVPKPPPIPECSDVYRCDEGEVCEDGQCVPGSPGCVVDTDCAENQTCEAPGICVDIPPPPPGCVTETDCAVGEVCEDGQCIPESPGCVLNTDCEVGEFCDNGTCLPEPGCVVDTDCAENQTCEAPGICVDVPPLECVIDADCDGALVCEAPGICVEPPPCEDNVDCELSSTCEVEEGECEVVDPDAGCVEQQGYWKNNPNDPTWQQLEPIELGGASYTQVEATALMQSPSDGDASLILIKQLIAAILNHGAGAGAPQTVINAFDAGQQWLLLNADADGKLPFGVDTSTAAGQEALALASFFENYNKGLAAGGPPPCE